MFDRHIRRWIDPPLDAVGSRLAARGIGADTVTLAGLALGLIAVVLIAVGWHMAAILPLLAGRVADGLDGAVARANRKTDFGGYLDIVADFLFYGAVPFAFVMADPAQNGTAGAFLILSFYVNGTSFLGFAILAEKRGMKTAAQGEKSIFFSNGILEGTETILFFLALCFWPDAFPALAWGFGALCFLTAGLRLWGARRLFSN